MQKQWLETKAKTRPSDRDSTTYYSKRKVCSIKAHLNNDEIQHSTYLNIKKTFLTVVICLNFLSSLTTAQNFLKSGRLRMRYIAVTRSYASKTSVYF